MKVLEYYRKRKSLEGVNLDRLIGLDFPITYLGFIVKYDVVPIISLISDEAHAIGFELNGNLISVDFLEPDSIHIYEVDYGDEVYAESIVKFADNNIPEGGLFYSLVDKKIYNFDCEPESIPAKERKAAFESFHLFFSSLNLYRLSNQDIDYRKVWDMKMPANKDDLVFPWET
jgi:hypothetical protein